MVILQFLVVAAAFAVIDAVWLKSMNPFYRSQIGDLLADKPHLGYAVVFYVMYIAGIVFFALRPALDGGSWLTAVGYGAALGAFAYATYDLTNAATLKKWPLQLIVVDILWGAVLTGARHAGGLAGLPQELSPRSRVRVAGLRPRSGQDLFGPAERARCRSCSTVEVRPIPSVPKETALSSPSHSPSGRRYMWICRSRFGKA